MPKDTLYTFHATEVPAQPPRFEYRILSPLGQEICRGTFFGKEEDLHRQLTKTVRRLNKGWGAGMPATDPEILEEKRRRGLRVAVSERALTTGH